MSQSQLVYRVQDDEGRGPFRPGFSHRWIDPYISRDRAMLPSSLQEFGSDVIQRNLRPGEFYGTATRSIFGLMKWFSPDELGRLEEYGYAVVAIDADRILAESPIQLLFARSRPLQIGAVMVPVYRFEYDSKTGEVR